MSSNEWKLYKLDELLLKRNQGVNTTTEKVKYSNNGIPVIRAQNILTSGLSFNDIAYVDEETFKRVRPECKPLINDILYTNIGSQFGTACKVNTDFPFLIAWNVLRLQPNSLILPEFLIYTLNNPIVKTKIQSLNSSSTMPFVSGKEMGNVELKVPNIEVQNKIASTLSALDEKIANNSKTNQTLEAIARTLFKEWFVNFNYPNADGGRKHSELGEIPSNWKIDGIGAISYVQNGYAFKSNDFKELGEVGIIKIKNINENVVEIENTDFVDISVIDKLDTKFKIESGSLLIAMTGAGVGKIGLVPLTEKYLWLNQRVGMFKEKITYGNLFMYLLLSSDTYQTSIQNSALGSAQPNISASAIESIRAIIPTAELIEAFGRTVNPMFEKILDNLAENETLKTTRDSLLPKFMSGEIDVNNSNG